MTRPYHHGALREALIDEAQVLLTEQGIEAISLRELARRIGVSHSAPERHFTSRQALLDALALRGFALLTHSIQEALRTSVDDSEDRLRAAAHAYVSFALDNSALLELMFTSKDDREDPAISTAEMTLFGLTAELVGESPDIEAAIGTSALRFVLVATLQGIANLAAAKRIPPEKIDTVIDEAVSILTPASARRQPPEES